jgi:hypothetical protein
MMCRNFGVSVGNHRNTPAIALVLGFRCDEWIIDCLASMVQYLPHLSQCLTDNWCEAGAIHLRPQEVRNLFVYRL